MNLMELFVKIGVDKSGFEKGIGETEKETKSFASRIAGGMGKITSGIGKVAMTSIKVGGMAMGAAATGVAALTKQAVSAYAENEQLVGGIKKLYGDNYQTVIDYANNAYKTVGMSANEYMSSTTAFTAKLVSDFGGDTLKAAGYADKAMRQIADNANTFGKYSVQDLTQVYQALARGSYMTLDNLQLGFSGTKQGMQELLATAKEITGLDYNIENFSDVIDAIQVVQDKLNISGTTAKEAASTISGSLNSVKSAWQNLLVGVASDGADFDKLINNLVESLVGVEEQGERTGGVINNIMPRIVKSFQGIGTLVQKVAPILSKELPSLIDSLLPGLLSAAGSLLDGVIAALPSLLSTAISTISNVLPGLLSSIMTAVKSIGKMIIDNSDTLIDAVFEIINSIIDVISDPDALSGLVDGAIKIIKKLGDSLSENIPVLLPTVVQMVMDLVTMLTSPENMETMLGVAVALLEAIADGLVNSIDIILDEAPGIIENLAGVFVKVLPKFFKGVFDVLVSNLGQLASIVLEKISGIGESIWGWLQEYIFTPISNFFSDVWNKIAEFFQPLIETIQPVLDSLGELFSAFGELATAAWELIKQKVGEAVDKVKEKFGEIWSKVSEVATNVWNKITEVFGNLVAPIEQPLQDFYDKVTGVFNDAKDWILGIVSDAWNWGHDLIQNIISGISSLIGSLTEKVKGVANTIFSWLHQSTADIGPLKDTDKWGVDLMDNIINGIESKRGELRREVEGVAESLDFNRSYTFTPAVKGTYSESVTGRGEKIDKLVSLLEKYLPEIGNIELDGEVVSRSVDSRLGRTAALKARV